MNRTEHLQWCKDRAIQILNTGDIPGAWASMVADLKTHPKTDNHPAIEIGSMLLLFGDGLSTKSEMKDFILGFN